MFPSTLRLRAAALVVGAAATLTASVTFHAHGGQQEHEHDVAADRARSKDNLRQIGQAMHKFYETRNHFPTAAIHDQERKPLLSWRVAILPYIGEEALYEEFRLDEPWDSTHNKSLLAKMPDLYAPPGIKTEEPNTTFYQVFVGAGALFDGTRQITLPDVTDGTSNTIMVIEAGKAVPWTKPQELAFDRNQELPEVGGIFEDGFHFVAVDGFVHFAEKRVHPQKMRAAITRAGGEPVQLNNLNP